LAPGGRIILLEHPPHARGSVDSTVFPAVRPGLVYLALFQDCALQLGPLTGVIRAAADAAACARCAPLPEGPSLDEFFGSHRRTVTLCGRSMHCFGRRAVKHPGCGVCPGNNKSGAVRPLGGRSPHTSGVFVLLASAWQPVIVTKPCVPTCRPPIPMSPCYQFTNAGYRGPGTLRKLVHPGRCRTAPSTISIDFPASSSRPRALAGALTGSWALRLVVSPPGLSSTPGYERVRLRWSRDANTVHLKVTVSKGPAAACLPRRAVHFSCLPHDRPRVTSRRKSPRTPGTACWNAITLRILSSHPLRRSRVTTRVANNESR